MVQAARVGLVELTGVIGQLPSYQGYDRRAEADASESGFRLALGRMLKECGDQLLNIVEKQPNLITSEQHDVIDALVDALGVILRRLNRQGLIRLRGGADDTIAELEELDLRLLLLLEEALSLAAELARCAGVTCRFQAEALRLSRRLAEFGKLAESRNFLLGLGWESELRLAPERGRR
jgi:hypothetical protein